MSDPTTTKVSLGDGITLTAVSEWVNNKRADTQIKLGGFQLCWVSGAEYDQFIEKLQDLINEYRI